jgi:steroid 5-alpha reductase family enzyme
MTLAWIMAVRWNFYSLVDVVWAYGIGVIGILVALFGSGNEIRRMLFSIFVVFWSIRLGTHLLLRLASKFPEEDQRYTQIKLSWNSSLKKNFFWFFQFQALSQPLLATPFLLAATNIAHISLFDGAAIFLSLLGILGETVSDSQLKKFKSDLSNKEKVCDIGFWKYSRHPNYFFEWVIWCGFACFGLTSVNWYYSLLSPLIMFLLLNFVTGVPPSEEQSLKSKGQLYKDYQRRTSRFFPWKPNVNSN